MAPPLEVRVASIGDANGEWFDVVVSRPPHQRWTLSRRFSDFRRLADAIDANYSLSPKLPQEQPWWWMARRKVSRDARRRRFEHYLRSLLADQRIREEEELMKFLGATEPSDDALEKFSYTMRSGRGEKPRKPVDLVEDSTKNREKFSPCGAVGERAGCVGFCVVV